MNRIGVILLTVAVVGALLAMPLGVSAATEHSEPTTEANSSAAPGERLAGAVGVQQATVDGDLSERTYEVRIRTADSDQQRADIVAERRDEIEQRLEAHRADLRELRAAREAGNISDGTYRARVATVAAEKSTTERAAQRAGATAQQLPADVLAERGISATALDELRTTASELGGEETAEIAREIGGRNTSGAAADRPTGPPNGALSGDGSEGVDRPGARAIDSSRETRPEGNTNVGRPADDGTPSDRSPDSDRSANEGSSDGKSSGDTEEGGSENSPDRDGQQNGAGGDADANTDTRGPNGLSTGN